MTHLEPQIDYAHRMLPAAIPPLQKDVDEYLDYKRLRLTPSSLRGYTATLTQFLKFFPATPLEEFEPPYGTRKVEAFLLAKWGHREGRTYNKNLTVMNDFFRRMVLWERLLRDPMPAIERARVSELRHEAFTPDERARILAVNPDPRDQIALRLLLDYGVRKGSLLNITFDSFNRRAHTVTFLMKGERFHTIPIPEDDRIWLLLAKLDQPFDHYLMCKRKLRRRRPPQKAQLRAIDKAIRQASDHAGDVVDETCGFEIAWAQAALDTARDWLGLAEHAAGFQIVTATPEEPMGIHAAHDWWYRCLERAGIVDRGVTRGQRMHKARHTAGQRVLDATGNLKAAQVVLGHKNVATTGNHYTGWDEKNTRETLTEVVPMGRLDESLLRAASTAARDRSSAG